MPWLKVTMSRIYKTLPRIFVDKPLSLHGELTLERDQSNYLVAVLRRGTGDELTVFNGRDGAWRAAISNPSKKATTLGLLEQITPQSPTPDLWYGFAPLKSARLDYMVQKATEMGAGTIQPVFTHHTQVKHIKHERLRANAIEAAEQCEMLSVPTIATDISLANLLDRWPKDHAGRVLILADEGAASSSPVEQLQNLPKQPLGLLIGPEGGFSEDERLLLRAKDFVVPISLGPRILRADTAAVAGLAVIQAIIGDWR